MKATLYYIHDPMCSWCWGFRPSWDALKRALSPDVAVVNITGGLARDCDSPMSLDMQQTIEGYWHSVQGRLGTEFNFDFWRLNQPRRSTYMSCRASIAAGYQSEQELMIDAVQRAYYLRALNPSDVSVLIQLAAELGLDHSRFERDLLSAETQAEFERQMKLARSLPIDGFPSLVLSMDDQVLKIEVDYLHIVGMLGEINNHCQAG